MLFSHQIGAIRRIFTLAAIFLVFCGLYLHLSAEARAEDVPTRSAESEITEALASFQTLRRDLGFGQSGVTEIVSERVRKPPQADSPESTQQAFSGSGQSMLSALCRVARPGYPGKAENCLDEFDNLATLRARVLTEQQALQAAADKARDLHDEVYDALIEEIFEKFVCRPNSAICASPESTREWWSNNGKRALMVLDRIGREHIKQTERLSNAALENARDHVHSRLQAVLVRPDIRIALRVLNEAKPKIFCPLLSTGDDRLAALDAVAAVSSWLQASISERLETQIMELPESTEGLAHLRAALGRTDKESSDTLAEAAEGPTQTDGCVTESVATVKPNALNALVGTFAEARQRLVEIATVGQELGRVRGCSFPDAGALVGRDPSGLAGRDASDEAERAEPKPTVEAVRVGLDGFGEYLKRCKKNAAGIAGLKDLLLHAEPGLPSRVEVAQALCRFGRFVKADSVEPLRAMFLDGVPASLATLVDGSKREVCDEIELVPRRQGAADKYLADVAERAETASDAERAQTLEAARAAIDAIEQTFRAKTRAKLDSMAGELWTIGQLLVDETLFDFEVVDALGTCTAANAPLALVWQPRQPTLLPTPGGLTFQFSSDLALCRLMPIRPPVEAADQNLESNDASDIKRMMSVWRFARAKGSVDVPLGGLFTPDTADVSSALGELRSRVRHHVSKSLKIDEHGLDAFAEAKLTELGSSVDSEARQAFLRETFADAFSRIVPSHEMRQRIRMDRLGYSLLGDGAGLELRVPVMAPDFELDVCVVVPLRQRELAIRGGCVALNAPQEQLWGEVERGLKTAVVTRMWPVVRERLAPFITTFPGVEAVVDAILRTEAGKYDDPANGIAFRLDLDRAWLAYEPSAAIAAVGGKLYEHVRPEDFQGRLEIVQDLNGGEPRIVGFPTVDLAVIAGRVYPGLRSTTVPIVALAPLPAESMHCKNADGAPMPGLGMAFGSALPLEGEIGALCWHTGMMRYAPPSSGNFQIALTSGDFRLDVEAEDADVTSGGTSNSQPQLRLVAAIEATGASDPWALNESGASVDIRLDLETGELTLPAMSEDNKELYAHIRGQAQSILPSGALISRIELSTNGIELEVVGLDGAILNMALERFFDADEVQRLANWAKDLRPPKNACIAIRAGTVATMLRSLKMPAQEVQESIRQICPDKKPIARRSRQPGSNELTFPGQDQPSLTWNCRVKSGEAGKSEETLNSCEVRFPQLDEYCGLVKLRLSRGRNFDANGPRLELRGAAECARRSLRPLVPDTLGDFVSEAPSDLELDCPDPVDPARCSIVATTELSFDSQLDKLVETVGPEDCERRSWPPLPAQLRLGIDGTLRPDANIAKSLRDLGIEVAEYTAKCLAAASADTAAQALDWLHETRKLVANATSDAAEFSGFACDVLLGAPFEGKDRVTCGRYGEDSIPSALLRTPPKALLFTRSAHVFDSRVDLEVTQTLAIDGHFSEPRIRVTCPGCGDRMSDLAEKVAKTMAKHAGRFVEYDTGATLAVAGDDLRFLAPLKLSIQELGVTAPFEIACTLAVFGGASFDCKAKGTNPEEILAAVVAETLRARVLGDGLTVPLGPLEGKIEKASHEKSRVWLTGEMTFPGLKQPAPVSVNLPLFGHPLSIDFKAEQLEAQLGEVLKDRVNDLVGTTVPVMIESVKIERDRHGRPSGVRLSSTASVQGLFTISVPDVLLTRAGLDIDGPNELAIGFPSGLQIVVPPATICPTGGAIGVERLVVDASVTVAECSAESFFSVKGRAEVALRTPGIFKIRGDMVLLKFLTLGNAEAELNLREYYLDTNLDIGGPVSDVISYRSEIRIEGGDKPHARAHDKLVLFRVPVNKQQIYIDFKKGMVEATLVLDLFGVISADGSFGMEQLGRNPYAVVDGSAQVLGLRLGDLHLTARPNYAKASFGVLGLRLTAVVPGIDVLSPDYLAKVIKNLLTPNLKDLDKAILALLSGKVVLNPIAKFGSGGEGALDGSDDGGEPSTGGEGLGADERAPEPVPESKKEEKKVESALSSPARPAKLNPPGRFHVVHEPLDDGAFAIELMEGKKVDTRIAVAPRHPLTDPIFDDKAGLPLAFTKLAYTHAADAFVNGETAVDGCRSNSVAPTVFTFSGVDDPLVGYFELCRMRTSPSSSANVEPIALEELSAPEIADLMRPFLTGLARVPESLPRLLDAEMAEAGVSEPVRVLTSGYAGTVEGIRMVAGMVAPGRLFLVADLPSVREDDDTPCTQTPAPSSRGPNRIRSYVLDASEITKPLDAVVLAELGDALHGLAACGSGAAVLYRAGDTNYLAANGYLGRWDRVGNRFVMVREPDPDEKRIEVPESPITAAADEVIKGQTPPIGQAPPIPPASNLVEKLLTQSADPESTAVPMMSGEASGRSLILKPDGERCVAAYSDGDRITGFQSDLFEENCTPRNGFAVDIRMNEGGAENSEDPGRVLLLEVGADLQTANLVHLGWGKGQRVALGRAWRTGPAFGAYEAALGNLPGDGPLTLERRTSGFDAYPEDAVPGAAGLVFTDDTTGAVHLAWGSAVGRGALIFDADVFGSNATTGRVDTLPPFLADLSSDRRLVSPTRLVRGKPVDGNPEYLILMPGSRFDGRGVPILAWDDAAGWSLAARLIETPRVGATSRKVMLALLSQRLDGLEGSESTVDAWLFRFSDDLVGVSLRDGTGVDEVIWRTQEWTVPDASQSDTIRKFVEKLRAEFEDEDAFFELCRIAAQAQWPRRGRIDGSSPTQREYSDWAIDNFRLEIWKDASERPSRSQYVSALMHLTSRRDCQYFETWPHEYLPMVDSREVREAIQEAFGAQVLKDVDTPPESDFGQHSVNIRGFQQLHSPPECHFSARAVLDTAGDINFAGHEILKHDPACGDGGVLVVQREDDAVRAISAYRSGGLVREVEIEGDPLPLHLLDPFRNFFGERSGDDPWMLEGARMELDDANTVWSTRHPDTDELVVLLTAAGDPKIITIKGLEPGAKNLGGLIAFAIASRGVRFDALKTTPHSTVLLVDDGAGSLWVVWFEYDEGFKPRYWVAVDDDSLTGGPGAGALGLVLEAVGLRHGGRYIYDEGTIPPRWTVASRGNLLAVRPLADGPYLVLRRDDSSEEYVFSRLCAPPVSTSTLLDLASRISGHFGRVVTDVEDIAKAIDTGNDDSCVAAKKEVAHFSPATLGADAGVLFGLDVKERLRIGMHTRCELGAECEFTPETTGEHVPEALVAQLVGVLRNHVADEGDAGEFRLLHDSALDASGDGEDRRLLFSWNDTSGGPGRRPGNRLLYAVHRPGENGGASFTCVPPPLPVEIFAGESLSIASMKDADRRRATALLLALLEVRQTEPESTLCDRLGKLRPFISIHPDGIRLFEEYRASLPAKHPSGATRQVRWHDGVRVASLGVRDVASPVSASGTRIGRTGSRLLSSGEGLTESPAVVTLPASLTVVQRGRIYEALTNVMLRSELSSIDLERHEDDPKIFSASFDAGSTLIVDAHAATPRIVRLNIAADQVIPPDILRNAAAGGWQDMSKQPLPAALDILEGARSWILAEPVAGRVWALGVEPANELGDLPELSSALRNSLLHRIAGDQRHFCARNVAGRAWYRTPTEKASCDASPGATRMRRWLTWVGGDSLPVETPLEPEHVPFDPLRHLVPAIRNQPNFFLQVTKESENRILVGRMVPCGPDDTAPGEGTVSLQALHRFENIGASEFAGDEIAIATDGATACILRGDLEPLLSPVAVALDAELAFAPSEATAGPYSGKAIPFLSLDRSDRRKLIGFRSEPIELISASRIIAGLSNGTDRSAFDWPRAIAALVAAEIRKASARVLMIPPDGGRGWLISDRTTAVEVDLNDGPKRSITEIAIPEPVFTNDANLALTTRLLIALRHELGRPGPKWPGRLHADGSPPFLAYLEQDQVFLAVHSSRPEQILDVETLGFGRQPPAMEDDSPVRRALRVSLPEIPSSGTRLLQRISLVATRADAFVAIFVSSIDDEAIRYLGVLSKGKIEPVQIRSPSPVSWDRRRAIAEAIDQDALNWKEYALEGNREALRFCVAGATSVRLIGRSEGTNAARMLDVDLWRDGNEVECGIATAEHDIDDLLGAITSREMNHGRPTALVFMSDTPSGLIARDPVSNAGGDKFTLFRQIGANTGCMSFLRGGGARKIAGLVVGNAALECDESLEFPPHDGPAVGAAIYATGGQLLLAREECTLVLAPHTTAPGSQDVGAYRAVAGDGSATRRLLLEYWAHFADANPCPGGEGKWFTLTDKSFGRRSDALWQNGRRSSYVDVRHVEPHHDLWVAAWMSSPGIADGLPSNGTASARPLPGGTAISIEVFRPKSRFHVTERTCLAITARDEDHVRSIHPLKFAIDHLQVRIGVAYVCDTVLVGAQHTYANGGTIPFHGLVTIDSTKFLECFLAMHQNSNYPPNCIKEITVHAKKGDALLIGQHPHAPLQRRTELIREILVGPESERAEAFLAALVSNWKIVQMEWSPHYRYTLTKGVGNTASYRYNWIDDKGQCRQISAREWADFLNDGSYNNSKCKNSDVECNLEELRRLLSNRDEGPSGRIWYSPAFDRDPRGVIDDMSVDCR